PRQRPDLSDGAPQDSFVEQVRRRIRQLVRRAVEVVGAVRGVDRITQRNLVGDHEERRLRTLEQMLEGAGVAPSCVVERLPARKGIAARMRALPGAVLVERLALELAEVDVSELGVFLERSEERRVGKECSSW